MASIQREFAVRDTRLETVALTGYITNNGSKNGVVPQVYAEQHPAYAAIDLTKSNNFYIDASHLTLRTDTSSQRFLWIYLQSNKPPSYYQNFEFDIFIKPSTEYLTMWIFANYEDTQTALISGGFNKLYSITNEIPTSQGDYSTTPGIMTFKVLNNKIILKSVSAGLTAYVS